VSGEKSSELATGGFWSAGRLFAAVLAFLWTCVFLSGIDGLIAFHDREPDLPVGGHLGLYAVLPTVGLLASSALLAYAKKLPGWLIKSALLAETLLLLPVLLFWSGGV
jgi:hypothetical protein